MIEFKKLYEDNQNFIFKFLLKMCENADLAEELTQEAFFRAYMNIPMLREEKAAKVWLCQIAKNCYFAWYNHQKNTVFLEDTNVEQIIVSSNEPEMEYLQKELSEETEKALNQLEEPFKEVFILHVLGNVSMKSISEAYGKSESSARVIFHRARQKLLSILEK
ncbi:MAG: sigma-70 family RNA polymerase sigma factor [Clostridia bacterium]|nr:sigma-70 family RNA polymerase sigma factor [Clostridia bacterium]